MAIFNSKLLVYQRVVTWDHVVSMFFHVVCFDVQGTDVLTVCLVGIRFSSCVLHHRIISIQVAIRWVVNPRFQTHHHHHHDDGSTLRSMFIGFGWSKSACFNIKKKHVAGWWFQTWILFSIIYGMSSFPLTFLCFKMVKTTNQMILLLIGTPP